MSLKFSAKFINYRQSGIAIFAVITLVFVSGLILAMILVQSKRGEDFAKRNVDDLRFKTVLSRLNNIMDSSALCTCNLKDTVVTPSGAVTYSSKMRIDESPTANPSVFGFYKLRSVGGDRGCETIQPTINNDDVVVSLRPNANYPKALKLKYVELSGFVLLKNVSPAVNRYKASLVFAALDRFESSKSNLNSPIKFDVYVEIDANSGQNVIRRCFLSANVKTPAPVLPPVAPPPAASPPPMVPPASVPPASPLPPPPPLVPPPVAPPPAAPPEPPNCSTCTMPITGMPFHPDCCDCTSRACNGPYWRIGCPLMQSEEAFDLDCL